MVEESVGLRLPSDYKDLVEEFPDGWFQGLVRLNRPGDDDHPATEFLGFYAYQLGDMRSWRETGHGAFPYPIYPEPAGLLPWARGPRLEPFFWLVEGENPDAWPVVAANYEFTEWRRFDGTACELLIEVVEGRFDGDLFGVDLAADGPRFEPIVDPPATELGQPGQFFWDAIELKAGWPANRFDNLRQLIGSPVAAVSAVDWAQVERRLAQPLPSDYKAFCDTYGPGTFCDIAIATPNASGEVNLFALLERKYRYVEGIGRPRTEYDPPLHPEPMGMIAWGETPDGYTLCWAPTGPDPDRWGIIIADPGEALNTMSHHPDLSFSALLSKYANPREEQIGLLFGREQWSGDSIFSPAEKD